jgi:hypothetical protein
MFDVAEDKPGKDETVFTNVVDGKYTEVISSDKLYIGHPRNAESRFVINIYVVYR